MSDSEDRKNPCPVCSSHTDEEGDTAEGLVITGIKAIFDQDKATLELLQEQFGAFEAHVAMSMLAGMIALSCQVTGTPIELVLDGLRSSLDRRMSHETQD